MNKFKVFIYKVTDGVKTVKEKITSDEVKNGAIITGILALMAVPLATAIVLMAIDNRDS